MWILCITAVLRVSAEPDRDFSGPVIKQMRILSRKHGDSVDPSQRNTLSWKNGPAGTVAEKQHPDVVTGDSEKRDKLQRVL